MAEFRVTLAAIISIISHVTGEKDQVDDLTISPSPMC
jgi:hypothetical protein